ncbi:hypothetical protein ACFW04_008234 [Cataglyphis niger]
MSKIISFFFYIHCFVLLHLVCICIPHLKLVISINRLYDS